MKSIYYFIKYNRYIRQAIKHEDLINKLKYLFGGREFKMDWVGRIYTVINPLIDDVNTEGDTLIYDDGRPMIEKWLMDNLNILSRFLTTNNLFDLMTYKINKIDDDHNYLVILQNLYYDNMKRSVKIIGVIGLILLIAAMVTLILI